MDNDFTETVWEYYRQHARHMPWRDAPSLYNVLVSEVMLQQTQVQRVIPKFIQFMQAFPSVQRLANAPLADVLRQWQGLGYNRRAKMLHEAAKLIVRDGVPDNLRGLMALPGVGYNTAAAIMNYAYDTPVAFVETNIRTVYFYHFFANRQDVSDKELVGIVERTMSRENPREWFWALMDYGAYLKAQGAGGLTKSRHYKKQSRFQGSVRQVRGRVIAKLIAGDASEAELRECIQDDELLQAALKGLMRDGLVEANLGRYHLTK